MLRGRPTYPLAYWTTTPSTRRLDDLGEVPKRRLVIECIRDRRVCFDGVGTTPLRVTQNATARGDQARRKTTHPLVEDPLELDGERCFVDSTTDVERRLDCQQHSGQLTITRHSGLLSDARSALDAP